MPNEPINKQELQRRTNLDNDLKEGKLEQYAHEYQQQNTLFGSGSEVLNRQKEKQALDVFALCLYNRWMYGHENEWRFLDSFALFDKTDIGYLADAPNQMELNYKRAKEVVLEGIANTVGTFSDMLENDLQTLIDKEFLGKVARNEAPIYIALTKKDEKICMRFVKCLDDKATDQYNLGSSLEKNLFILARETYLGKFSKGKAKQFSDLFTKFLFEEKIGFPSYLHAKQDEDIEEFEKPSGISQTPHKSALNIDEKKNYSKPSTVWLQYVGRSL